MKTRGIAELRNWVSFKLDSANPESALIKILKEHIKRIRGIAESWR